ncbi:AAA family ATPase [Stutzerimonas stutzeri]
MRITNIEITNIQGLRHAALTVSEPLLVVSGNNGAGKSSLLDAISMALTGQPSRVDRKKDMAQLVTEGQKKGEAVITWETGDGEESAGIALPSGKGAPLVDLPALPFVLDASRFAALDNKERRRVLFDLTGAKFSPAEVARRLAERGADAALIERVKPMLRAGFDAAAAQAKDHAAEARGAWKQLSDENYGSEKAEGWEPEAAAQITVTQDEIDTTAGEVVELDTDLAEAQQTLGGQKALLADAAQRTQRIEQLQELASHIQRRQNKLNSDRADLAHWQSQLASAQAAASGGQQGLIHDLARHLVEWQELAARTEGVRCKSGGPVTPWFVLPEMDRLGLLLERYVAEHGPIADGEQNPELAKREPEYRGYVEQLSRAVANSERDLREAQDAATQVQALEAAAAAPSPDAIANAEQVINKLRQERDAKRAKLVALQDAFDATTNRDKLIAQAAHHHAQVKAWVLIADALAPAGIPAEILASALEPVNTLLAIQSAAAKWQTVAISDEIEVTYGGRLYGLLSESEKWRCDAMLAVAIARLSGIRFVTLDRFDVLQPSARPQILGLLRTLTQGGDLNSAILAGTMKEPMAKVPSGIQAVWIEDGVIHGQLASAA